ncbi:hypothetical protein BHM03_00033498 [Ensete ventricosum]|nr:hypothetical protein BHM03_00033498 [Ensete ventricosum]
MSLRVPPNLRCQYPSLVVRLKEWVKVAVDDSNGFGRNWVWMQQVVPKVVQQKFSAKRVLLLWVRRFEGAVESAKDFCDSGLRLGRKV